MYCARCLANSRMMTGHRYVLRDVFLDLEPSVVDKICTETYRHLFHPEQMVSGKEEDAKNGQIYTPVVGHLGLWEEGLHLFSLVYSLQAARGSRLRSLKLAE